MIIIQAATIISKHAMIINGRPGPTLKKIPDSDSIISAIAGILAATSIGKNKPTAERTKAALAFPLLHRENTKMKAINKTMKDKTPSVRKPGC